MKIVNNPRFAVTTIRKVKNDDGEPIGLIGVVDDMLRAGLFEELSGVDGWEWCIIYLDGRCEFFDEREEMLAHLKEAVA